MTTRSRRALTLVEITLATAMMATLLVTAHGLVIQGFQSGSDLQRRETADALGRNMLDRYSRLPLPDLEKMFALRSTVDISVQADEALKGADPAPADVLRSAGYSRTLSFAVLPGERAATVLSAKVSWPGPNDTERSMTFTRYAFVSGDGTKPLEQAPAFAPQADGGQWGHSRSWSPSRSDSLKTDVAGTAAPSNTIEFTGDPATIARYTGTQGELGAWQGDSATVARQRQLRREARFLTQAGIPRDKWPAQVAGTGAAVRRATAQGAGGRSAVDGCTIEEGGFMRIPDGTYNYRLEAVDLRDSSGAGAILGVYLLRHGDQRFRLLARSTHKPKRLDEVEGQPVEETRAFVTATGSPVILRRTQERLYAVERGVDPTAQMLHVQTLEGDGWDPKVADAGINSLALRTRLKASSAVAFDDLWAVASAAMGAADPSMAGSAASSAATLGPAAVGQVGPASAPAAVPRFADRALTQLGMIRHTAVRFRTRINSTGGPVVASSRGRSGAHSTVNLDRLVVEAGDLAATDPHRAIGLLDERLGASPDDPEALALRGRLRAFGGQLDSGIDDLRAAARQKPEDVALMRDLSGVLLQAGRGAEARQMISLLAAAAPSDPAVQMFKQSLALLDSGPPVLAQAAPPSSGGTSGGGSGSAPGVTLSGIPAATGGGSSTGRGGGSSGPSGSGAPAVPPVANGPAAGPASTASGSGKSGGVSRGPKASMDWGTGSIGFGPSSE